MFGSGADSRCLSRSKPEFRGQERFDETEQNGAISFRLLTSRRSAVLRFPMLFDDVPVQFDAEPRAVGNPNPTVLNEVVLAGEQVFPP
jgi:hypothetical protein